MAEMAAVAGILGLSDRITQELVSLQPRRALARPNKPLCHGFACKPRGRPNGGDGLLRMHLHITRSVGHL